ncbi:hypothetical protein PAXRUDRAFT_95498, partial [Paxillus rubicundulus Ve08.2h10]
FKCTSGLVDCCCHHILYNQHDFIHVESLLEITCKRKGFRLLSLLKFHCELNFIEQCWGYTKQLYHCCSLSSKEADLELNVIILDSVPIESICKFETCSLHFMDAYHKGLNGKKAAFVARKCCGHQTLPLSVFDNLERANM